jgi:hypothetical protein
MNKAYIPAIFLILFTIKIQTAEAEELTVIKYNTEQKSDFVKETRIEIGVATKKETVNSIIQLQFEGSIRPPKRDEPGSLFVTNSNKSLIGFNMRLGDGIYDVYLANIENGRVIFFPSLKEVIGRQIQSVDSGLSDESFILTEANEYSLKFKYIGKEFSPNYFDFFAIIKNASIIVDKKSLFSALKTLGF